MVIGTQVSSGAPRLSRRRAQPTLPSLTTPQNTHKTTLTLGRTHTRIRASLVKAPSGSTTAAVQPSRHSLSAASVYARYGGSHYAQWQKEINCFSLWLYCTLFNTDQQKKPEKKKRKQVSTLVVYKPRIPALTPPTNHNHYSITEKWDVAFQNKSPPKMSTLVF